ncbi:MAG TPA: MFS transporter [Terriglobia bacterium]|nr:MFS transporter [Terriglobia bacterium]
MKEGQSGAGQPAPRLTGIQWVICIIAVIGFAFDTYEILMLPLILRPAIVELTGVAPGTQEYVFWARLLFFIPAFAAGIFGLLGGYLTDLFGRRRVLTFSILLYGFSAFASAFSTSIEMLLFLRCLVFIGVSVEFVAAVAWLAELFPHPQLREKVLGYTQACSSFGGLRVGAANSLCIAYAASFPSISAFGLGIADPNAAWRYTLMTGVIPAIPLLVIRPFLPESPIWREKRAAGTLKRPSIAAIFSPELRRTTIVTTIMFAMSYGAAFGAIQQLPQIIPGLPEVRAQTQGLARPAAQQIEQDTAADITLTQELGGLTGRFILAVLASYIISRRKIIRMYQVPGLIVFPIVFGIIATTNLNLLYIGAFIAGLLTVGQFSFWGNYLPRVYPVHLRGTGESFAANIGGRLVGTSFAYVSLTLAQTADPQYFPTKMALVAATVGFSVYLVGFIASFWLPEPKQEELPE